MRAAIYARVSGSRQEQEQTIASQVEALRGHVRDQGWALDERHVYTDDGVSGTRLDRPALDGLRDAVAEGQVDVIVLTCPDRLARNYVHQWVLLDEFQRQDVQVAFQNRPITATAEDQLLLHVQGAMAEYERAKILERTRRGRLYKARTGGMLGWGLAPFGYRHVRHPDRRGGTAAVEETQALWVRKMFAWLLEDHLGCRQIAHRLTAAGVRSPRRARHWYPSTVALILKNPVYTGRSYYNRTETIHEAVSRGAGRPEGRRRSVHVRPREDWIEIRVPALVDTETFQRAQERLRRNQSDSARRTRPGSYLLRGVVRCGRCGHRMNGYRNAAYPYYACVAHQYPDQTATAVRCSHRPVRADFLDEFVWNHLRSLLLRPGLLEDQLRQQRQAGSASPVSYEKQFASIERHIEAQNRRLDRLLDLYEDGSLDKHAFQERQRALQTRVDALRREHDDLARQQRDTTREASLLEGVDLFRSVVQAGAERASFDDRQRICRLVIERIDVDGEDVVIKHILPALQNTAQ